MSTSKRCCLAVALACLAWGHVPRCSAQANPFVAPTASVSQTQSIYDRFGSLRGVYTVIWLNNGDVWWFALPQQFLNLPLAWQVNYIATRFGTGMDTQQIASVLQSIQTQQNINRMNQLNQQIQQNVNMINRMNQQQIWQPPPPPVIPRPGP